MAINIFSGSGGKPSGGVNKASNTVRAKNARAALQSTSAETSNAGTTAVESKGALGKVGETVGKVAGIVSKFLPGIGGTIASGLSNVLNDPEWWQAVPGDALTLNEPLRFIEQQTTSAPAAALRSTLLEFTFPEVYMGTGGVLVPDPADNWRSSFYDSDLYTVTVAVANFGVMQPTERMITQYLMPQIRRVVNAIPLQDANDYREALVVNATIYAFWRELRKIDYMCKHGQTYLASMNDEAFPLFKTTNAAWLQATINRLEEYLRANVRLPHTLCEYLAWRFGRVYKSNNSAKAALVLYDAIPLAATPAYWDAAISILMNRIAKFPAVQRANTDLYNTYYDHDYLVEVRDDTQFKFDSKEFMLRCNLMGVATKLETANTFALDPNGSSPLIVLDSALDNPTAFMASTVSASGKEQNNSIEVLFPVNIIARVYIPAPEFMKVKPSGSGQPRAIMSFSTTDGSTPLFKFAVNADYRAETIEGDIFASNLTAYSENWLMGIVDMDRDASLSDNAHVFNRFADLITAKAVDLYNFMCDLSVEAWNGDAADTKVSVIDVSALSIDAGSPTLTVLNTEHVYAFANLVDIDRKHSMSYRQAEHLVAKDTANLIEKLDVAAAGDKK